MAEPRPNFDLGPHVRPGICELPLHPKSRKSGFLNLSSNEFVHPRVVELLSEAIGRITPEDLRAYPYQPELTEALAAHYRLDPGGVLLSAGSDSAIKLVIEALFATSGVMILQDPTYAGCELYAAVYGVRVVAVPFGEDRPGSFTLRQFERALGSVPPCGLLLSNPNGPTGHCLTKDEMLALAGCCFRGGHLLVIDEAYIAYSGMDHLDLLRRFEHVVIIRSLSKSFGLAGMRVAFLATSPTLARYLARWNTSNPVSGATVKVVQYMLGRESVLRSALDEIVACRDWFAARVLEAFPRWRPIASSANFVNFDTGSPQIADSVAAHLRTRGILVRSMSSVTHLAGCVRISIGDRATMERVLIELSEFNSAAG
jgi:histidinol-phosphate aminotransferase